jgi:hypothetical protein
MALPLAAIGLGLGAVGAVGNLFSASAAASARRREVAEQVRRFEADAARAVSAGRAAGGASGIESDSASLQGYLASMSDEFKRQADWMRKTGTTQARLGMQAGILGAATGIGGALFSFGAQNNWWRDPLLPSGGAQTSYTPGSGMPLWR